MTFSICAVHWVGKVYSHHYEVHLTLLLKRKFGFPSVLDFFVVTVLLHLFMNGLLKSYINTYACLDNNFRKKLEAGKNANLSSKLSICFVYQLGQQLTVLVFYQTAGITTVFPQCFIKSLQSHHVSRKEILALYKPFESIWVREKKLWNRFSIYARVSQWGLFPQSVNRLKQLWPSWLTMLWARVNYWSPTAHCS